MIRATLLVGLCALAALLAFWQGAPELSAGLTVFTLFVAVMCGDEARGPWEH